MALTFAYQCYRNSFILVAWVSRKKLKSHPLDFPDSFLPHSTQKKELEVLEGRDSHLAFTAGHTVDIQQTSQNEQSAHT